MKRNQIIPYSLATIALIGLLASGVGLYTLIKHRRKPIEIELQLREQRDDLFNKRYNLNPPHEDNCPEVFRI
ncbi:MAG: hypothetical protein ABIB79_02890 [archaeon]